MLSKKGKIVLAIVLCGILLIVVVCINRLIHRDSIAVAVDVPMDEHATDGIAIYQYIDTLMCGKWQHISDTTWFRVYTSEPAGEGYCWGREWNTAEDISEADLMPYGNGWFKWKKVDKSVVEFQMTEINNTIIPYEYKVLKLDFEQLQFKENLSSKKHHFRKI
jgi:hypothetical protein